MQCLYTNYQLVTQLQMSRNNKYLDDTKLILDNLKITYVHNVFMYDRIIIYHKDIKIILKFTGICGMHLIFYFPLRYFYWLRRQPDIKIEGITFMNNLQCVSTYLSLNAVDNIQNNIILLKNIMTRV